MDMDIHFLKENRRHISELLKFLGGLLRGSAREFWTGGVLADLLNIRPVCEREVRNLVHIHPLAYNHQTTSYSSMIHMMNHHQM